MDTFNEFFNLNYCPFIARANEPRIRPNPSSNIQRKGMFVVFSEIKDFGGFDMYYLQQFISCKEGERISQSCVEM